MKTKTILIVIVIIFNGIGLSGCYTQLALDFEATESESYTRTEKYYEPYYPAPIIITAPVQRPEGETTIDRKENSDAVNAAKNIRNSDSSRKNENIRGRR